MKMHIMKYTRYAMSEAIFVVLEGILRGRILMSGLVGNFCEQRDSMNSPTGQLSSEDRVVLGHLLLRKRVKDEKGTFKTVPKSIYDDNRYEVDLDQMT